MRVLVTFQWGFQTLAEKVKASRASQAIRKGILCASTKPNPDAITPRRN